MIASLRDNEKFRQIVQLYAVDNPGDEPAKFLDVKRWMRVNIERVRELRLDDRKRRRILDLGCGAGYFLFICSNYLGHDVLGLDIDDVPLYAALTQLLEVPRVIWRIAAFVPLPDLGEFDLITAFLTCFNNPLGPGLWGIAEWDFFLRDVAHHLSSRGRLWLEFNRQSDGRPFSAELKRFFKSRGGKVDVCRVVFNSDRLAPASISPVAR